MNIDFLAGLIPRVKREALHYQITSELSGQSPIHAIAFSPDGARIGVAGESEIAIWSLRDTPPSKLHSCEPNSPTTCLAWLDDNHLLSGTADGRFLCVRMQTVPRPRLVVTDFKGHTEGISSIDVNQASTRCVTTAGTETCVWRYESGTDGSDWFCDFYLPEPPKIAGNQSTLVKALCARWARWRDTLLVSYERHGIVLWDVANYQAIRTIERNGAFISLAPPNSGPRHEQLLAISTSALGVDIYDSGSSRSCGSLSIQSSGIGGSSPVLFVHRGLAVLGGGYNGDVHLWDVSTKNVIQLLRHTTSVTALSAFVDCSQDTFYIATATNANGTVSIWKTVDIARGVEPTPQPQPHDLITTPTLTLVVLGLSLIISAYAYQEALPFAWETFTGLVLIGLGISLLYLG